MNTASLSVLSLWSWSRPALSLRLVEQRSEHAAATQQPRSAEQSKHEELHWDTDQGSGGKTLQASHHTQFKTLQTFFHSRHFDFS